jgi:hypothetical protein
MRSAPRVRAILNLLLIAVIAGGSFLFIAPSPVFAATFAVDSTLDTPDANPGDGTCADASGNCTLRAAVMEADDPNNRNDVDIITVPPGTYVLTQGQIYMQFGDTIQGVKADGVTPAERGEVVIDAQGNSRIFHFEESWNGRPTFTLNNMTLRNGDATVYADDWYKVGGAIYARDADVTLNDVIVSDNVANEGGGIYVRENTDVTIVDSVVGDPYPENDGSQPDGGADQGNLAYDWGGGLYIKGTVTLRNTTTNTMVSGNRASASDEQGNGGGIYLHSDGTLRTEGGSNASNSDYIRISFNYADQRGGGLFLDSGEIIVDDNDTTNWRDDVVESTPKTIVLDGVRIRENSVGVTESGLTVNRSYDGRNHGGGIYTRNNTLRIYNSDIWANSATTPFSERWDNDNTSNSDGTLSVYRPSINGFDDVRYVHDYWGTGGGIARHDSGTLVISNTTVRANTALMHGGAIEHITNLHRSNGEPRQRAVLRLHNVDFTDNSVEGAWLAFVDYNPELHPHENAPSIYGDGGAIFIEALGADESLEDLDEGGEGEVTEPPDEFIGNGSTTMTEVTFRFNTAGHIGGALKNTNRTNIDGALFEGNEAGTHPDTLGGLGGAIANYTGDFIVTNTLFKDNVADENGGGVYNHSADMNIYRSAFIGNTASAVL